MKVLMIVSWYSNYDENTSAGIFHYEQAIALQKYCEVALVWPFDQHIDGTYSNNVEKNLHTYRIRINDKMNGFGWGTIKRIYCLRKVIKQFRPDIIHAHVANSAGKLAIILGKMYHIPVVVTEHTPIELMNLNNKKNYYINKWVYKNSNANICVSPDLQNKLSSIFTSCKFSVICNGVIDPDSVPDDGNQYAEEGYINCCIVASFYDKEIKGYQYLLPAVKQLIDEGYRLKLHICGGGKFLPFYLDLARKLGLKESCIFYGQCNKKKVYSIMRQMDFSISASLFESAGVAVEEAMLLGLPLVVTKSGGASSLVSDSTAIVVESHCVKSLMFGIKKMVREKSLFQNNDIKAYAIQKFSMEVTNLTYLKLYSQLLLHKL